MRRSFGGNQGMGGGGGGGGGMLRTVARAVTRAGVGGVQETFSNSSGTTTSTGTTTATRPTTPHKLNSSNILSLSSSTSPTSPFSSQNLPISATSTAPTWPSFSSPSSLCDEFEWVSVDGSEDERGHGFFDDFVLGPVPSMDEVQSAVSAMKQVFDPASYSQFTRDRYAAISDKDVAHHIATPGLKHGVSSIGSELDWIEPSLQLCNSRMLQPCGFDRVYDAFHLLQTEPAVQKMVISLSSDKAVWDAVLNNEVVRELRESFNTAENNSLASSDEGSDGSAAATNMLKLIFDSTKAKAVELIEKITKLVNQLFHTPDSDKTTDATDPFEEKLRTSFLLTVVVLLIVAVTRAQGV